MQDPDTTTLAEFRPRDSLLCCMLIAHACLTSDTPMGNDGLLTGPTALSELG
jgi:hypothetical protein